MEGGPIEVRTFAFVLEPGDPGREAEIDLAVPCGLIVNELLSNALKHAFPNGRQGGVVVELAAAPAGGFILSVTDNGVGLPVDLDIMRTGSVDMTLVKLRTQRSTSKEPMCGASWIP